MGWLAERRRRRERALFTAHLEAHLGEIERGQWLSPEDAEIALSVLRFPDRPMVGAATYVTLGLSKYHLDAAHGHVRQELMYAQEDERVPFEAAHLIAALVEEAIADRAGFTPGEVVGPRGPVLDDSELESLLCSHPAYFAEDLEPFADPGDLPIELVMVAPVSAAEVAVLDADGWEAFQDRVAAADPNLLDWRRGSFL